MLQMISKTHRRPTSFQPVVELKEMQRDHSKQAGSLVAESAKMADLYKKNREENKFSSRVGVGLWPRKISGP
jgi:hypothetical protein